MFLARALTTAAARSLTRSSALPARTAAAASALRAAPLSRVAHRGLLTAHRAGVSPLKTSLSEAALGSAKKRGLGRASLMGARVSPLFSAARVRGASTVSSAVSSAGPGKNAPVRTFLGSSSGGGGGGGGYSSSSSSSSAFGLSHKALLLLGGASAAGMLLNAASGFASADASGADSFDTTTRKRLTATYLYVAGGLAVTAASAVAMFRAGLPRFMAARPWVFLGLSLAGTFGASIAVHSIDYSSTIPKHLALGVFNVAIAASLCPLVAVAPSILLNAAGATAALLGGLSLLAASAPSESFLWMRGPLTIGLGVVFAASIGSAFFPAIPILHSVMLYGGLGLFSAFALYDTSRTISRAKMSPPGTYDPINNAVKLYMDFINVFVRMVMILSNSNGKRK